MTKTALHRDNSGKASLLLFPAALEEVYHVLGTDIPSLPKVYNALMAAVIPSDPWHRIVGDHFPIKATAPQPGLRTQLPVIQKVSEHLLNQLRGRLYTLCLWPLDEVSSTYQVETQHLRDILRSNKAREVDRSGEYRIIFMHVALFRYLDKLPDLSTIRQRPEIHFFSYGTDALVPRQQWGVKPIFPLGECDTVVFLFYL